MLKVMLVDDEINIVEGLGASIDWRKHGFDIPSIAFNGREGLLKALETGPDLIITDITMPVMDGLEMVKCIRDSLPDVRIIFLTCHEDFNYVRNALKLNADEYLLKVTMTKKELCNLLDRIRTEIESKKESVKKEEDVLCELNKNRHLIGEFIINDILSGDAPNMHETEKRLKINGYRLDGNKFILSVIKLDNFICLLEDNIFNDIQLVKYSTLAIIENIIKKHDAGDAFARGSNEFILIYSVRDSIKTSLWENAILISKVIQSEVKMSVKATCTVYIGKSFDMLIKASKSYKELLFLKNDRFYLHDEQILVQEHAGIENNYPSSSSVDHDGRFGEYLEKFDIDHIREIVDLFINESFSRKVNVKDVKQIMEKLFMTLSGYISRMGYTEHDLTHIPFNEIIRYTDNIFSLGKTLVELSQKAISIAAKNISLNSSFELKKISRYINDHLQENITLESVSAYVNMNTSYFSRYFKNKTGENFVDYLSGIRIEKAEKLLLDTELSIDEIVEMVGHVNKSYFIKVFKKHTGVTPGEFRSIYRKKAISINTNRSENKNGFEK